jgi:hypothetical protein
MRRGRAWALRLHWLGMLPLWLLALMLLIICLAFAQNTKETDTKKPWTGKWVNGPVITRADLDRILQEHGRWLKSEGKEVREGQRADLAGAILSGADLRGADLSGADLAYASLDGAFLANSNLSRSNPWHASLKGADLSGANLSRANLNFADLSGVYLNETDLSRAYLISANLSGAILWFTNLNEALMDEAVLNGAFFDPKQGSLKEITGMATLRGLSLLEYRVSPRGLVELREILKKAGMRDQERQVTYALNHTLRKELWKKGGFLNRLESLFQRVCFEWTCQYGMNPGRPLEILGLGLFLFTLPYLLALRSRNRETGIWLVLPPDRIIGGDSKVRPFKLTRCTPFRPFPPGRWPRIKATLRRSLRRLRLAFYFSLLSAFNLGWRELNVGNWISRLQKREYTLRATGWPRTVAGLQSLLSVYLLALWVLTYFGRPFD